MSSRRRSVMPAEFFLHGRRPYRELHVRLESLPIVQGPFFCRPNSSDPHQTNRRTSLNSHLTSSERTAEARMGVVVSPAHTGWQLYRAPPPSPPPSPPPPSPPPLLPAYPLRPPAASLLTPPTAVDPAASSPPPASDEAGGSSSNLAGDHGVDAAWSGSSSTRSAGTRGDRRDSLLDHRARTIMGGVFGSVAVRDDNSMCCCA
jgi:hypothetical protein